ncbi:hypothetical protein [Nocardioides hwasunensis]|uniref:DUF2567 domain-containing protein n=1 Tax=Nocardioides hwasunensis TaxID=397258 RepID=A0ABR8MC12_9ACTN|nr:hypothetical protein [Nocardioides hwasunensis]MBD3913478.1 hypothetical protein [Nocardioides hwasunensis]
MIGVDEASYDTGAERPATERRGLLRRLVLVAAMFLLAGALGGVLWEWLWKPPTGLTYQGTWFLEPAGPDVSFEGVALFVVIAFPLGLLLAVLAGVWSRHEVATTLTVLVAASAAGVLMYAVGHALGPTDPQTLAAAKPDYTTLPADIGLSAPDRGQSAWLSTALLALPSGAMTGLVGTYLFGSRGFTGRRRG